MTFLQDGKIFVGNQEEYETFPLKDDDEYAYVLAAKFPWHRETLGYTGVAAPKDSEEYLIARRGNKLVLNLIDPKDPQYVSKECMKAGVDFVDENIKAGKRIGIFCNKGESRSPAIAMLYLKKKGLLEFEKMEDGVEAFKALHPFFQPSEGMKGFLKLNWKSF